jgi:glutathione peroxidase
MVWAILQSQPSSIYDLQVKNIENETISMGEFRGQVLLIVNTASRCGFTPQYEGLQKLYESKREQGFKVLGFPSNDFGGQEPGTADDIKEFCKVNYGVTFPLFAKAPVSGEEIQPLYRFLTQRTSPQMRGRVGWNFTKFLVSRRGDVTHRFSSFTGPQSKALISAVDSLLAEPKQGKSKSPPSPIRPAKVEPR